MKTTPKRFALLNSEAKAVSTHTTKEEAIAAFETTPAATIIVRTNRALTPGKTCWQWQDTIQER